ncbi:MAG: RNA-dependent RNA polymerase [Phaeoacremonium minimum tetramycovirus 1]|nr:MAG: RNA-dependent RNA polymerase [Phaeoacremonium minimum tetramycovirus 1]
MSYSGSGAFCEKPLAVVDETCSKLSADAAFLRAEELVKHVGNITLRGGLFAVDRKFKIARAPGLALESVMVRSSVEGKIPPVVVPQLRASAFRVKPRADGDLISRLREMDGVRGEAVNRKVPFYRSVARLEPAIGKAAALKNPSFRISEFQLPRPFSFGGGPPNPERPLIGPVIGAFRRAAGAVDMPAYGKAVTNAIDSGDYTTHDPDTLHPRFLEYVHERTTKVDDDTAAFLSAAVNLRARMWKGKGIQARARPLSDAEPETLLPMIKKGSPGEYRILGASNRRDKRLVATMSASLLRYAEVGKRVGRGLRPPAWVGTTMQPTLQFGKEEPKARKLKDGKWVPPIPRFIFNPSPVNYALATFLHGDLSHELQLKDPAHGPGFGPGRGRAHAFTSLIEKCFGDRTETPDGEALVMSDIEKWDANFPEVLIGAVMDMIEAAVDVSHLSRDALATRRAMFSVSKRQLLEKLLEHPSGYLVHLYGCMPSGSFYTSFVNTEGNNLLLLSHMIERVVRETSYTAEGAADELLDAADGLFISYGDNQLFSERILKHFGLRYDKEKHVEFLARFGMTLKADETEVTHLLGRVRFCSRAVVSTPEGLLVTRTHTSFAAKLAGRPEHDPTTDKLYVRALMCDTLGTDPILFRALSSIDRAIPVALDLETISRKTMPVISSAAKSLLGTDDDWALSAVLTSLTSATIDRRALLSLHTPRSTGESRGERLGSGLTIGGKLFGGPITAAADWASSQTPESYFSHLASTNQTGVLID